MIDACERKIWNLMIWYRETECWMELFHLRIWKEVYIVILRRKINKLTWCNTEEDMTILIWYFHIWVQQEVMIEDVYFWWWSPWFKINFSLVLLIKMSTYDLVDWYLCNVPFDVWSPHCYDVDYSFFLDDFTWYSCFWFIIFPSFGLHIFLSFMFDMSLMCGKSMRFCEGGYKKFC